MTVVTFLLLVYGLIVALLVVSIVVTAGRRLTGRRRLRLVSRRCHDGGWPPLARPLPPSPVPPPPPERSGARLKTADGRTVGRLVARAIRRRAEDTQGES